jgi:hypothetical protein
LGFIQISFKFNKTSQDRENILKPAPYTASTASTASSSAFSHHSTDHLRGHSLFRLHHQANIGLLVRSIFNKLQQQLVLNTNTYCYENIFV